MASDVQRPNDLAQRLDGVLRREGHDVRGEILESLLETLYFASLRTEEGESIRCQVAYMDPANPDPSPPKRVVKDRWQVTALGSSITLNVASVVKLAKATDPRTSSFAVYEDANGGVQIWGLVDQGNQYHDFVNFDSGSGPQPPGLFLASIDGPGQITVRRRFMPIGTLRIDRILVETVDVFHTGPVRDALRPGIDMNISRAREVIGQEVFDYHGHWELSLTQTWIATLCRLLLRARHYGHGGALLITPDDTEIGLNIQYRLDYPRLIAALDTRAKTVIRRVATEGEIHDLLEDDVDEMAMGLYLKAVVERSDEDDNRSELDGAIWFISLLTRVDGLVLMTPDLAVRGFGVEITLSDPPATISRALDAEAASTTNLAYTQYGTRHRSMMRYCWAIPGSVGFVVSQDGDVRVMTRRTDELLMWENPLLQMQIDRSLEDAEDTNGDTSEDADDGEGNSVATAGWRQGHSFSERVSSRRNFRERPLGAKGTGSP